MRAYFQQLLYRIHGSYWFIPSLMVLGAIVLSQTAITIDHRMGNEWLRGIRFVSLNQPDGARALLATVAGSMITVAGVTFSLTILAVSHATSHFGPRLLDNFMRDRGNQITLGTFVATFLYCLLVLRVVRGEGVSGPESLQVGVFVPQLSLLIALALTVASVAELIYFIHHVPESMHISRVLQRLAIDMSAKFDELYPETLGDALDRESGEPLPEFEYEHQVVSNRSGYLQGIDDKVLMEIAEEQEAVIRLLSRPGDFVRENQPLAEVTRCKWSDELQSRIRQGVVIDFDRNPTQDIFFILNQFVEVAARALSPGVNDPFTAMQCLDWLSVGMVELSQRELPPRFRTDSENRVRIVTTEVRHEDFVQMMFEQLVPYVRKDENVRRYFIETLTRVIEISENRTLNRLLEQQIRQVNEGKTDGV